MFNIIFIFFLTLNFSGDSLLKKFEKKFYNLKSFRAEFTQKYFSFQNDLSLEERGVIYFKYPDKMKWEYIHPDRKIFLYKEGDLFIYFPEEGELERGDAEFNFFLEMKKPDYISKNFEVSVYTKKRKSIVYKLIPKERKDYLYFLLEIDEKINLTRISIFLEDAVNEIVLKKFKSEINLPDEIFTIE